MSTRALGKLAKQVTPPILYRHLSRLARRGKDELFDGDRALFERCLSNSSVYGEYGCGASTRWVLENTSIPLLGVDTDQNWIRSIDPENRYEDRLNLHWVDLGEVRAWGRPVGYGHAHRFHVYTNWIWEQDRQPDTILIDGRFRVCCFFTTILNAEEGASIIFDDYVGRRHYHIVEEFVPPAEMCGRQCLFRVPERKRLDTAAIRTMIDNFRYVMD